MGYIETLIDSHSECSEESIKKKLFVEPSLGEILQSSTLGGLLQNNSKGRIHAFNR
jgi:hypothetical protein